jgi:hypothetical protein
MKLHQVSHCFSFRLPSLKGRIKTDHLKNYSPQNNHKTSKNFYINCWGIYLAIALIFLIPSPFQWKEILLTESPSTPVCHGKSRLFPSSENVKKYYPHPDKTMVSQVMVGSASSLSAYQVRHDVEKIIPVKFVKNLGQGIWGIQLSSPEKLFDLIPKLEKKSNCLNLDFIEVMLGEHATKIGFKNWFQIFSTIFEKSPHPHYFFPFSKIHTFLQFNPQIIQRQPSAIIADTGFNKDIFSSFSVEEFPGKNTFSEKIGFIQHGTQVTGILASAWLGWRVMNIPPKIDLVDLHDEESSFMDSGMIDFSLIAEKFLERTGTVINFSVSKSDEFNSKIGYLAWRRILENRQKLISSKGHLPVLVFAGGNNKIATNAYAIQNEVITAYGIDPKNTMRLHSDFSRPSPYIKYPIATHCAQFGPSPWYTGGLDDAGTSFSAPIVSATISLIQAIEPIESIESIEPVQGINSNDSQKSSSTKPLRFIHQLGNHDPRISYLNSLNSSIKPESMKGYSALSTKDIYELFLKPSAAYWIVTEEGIKVPVLDPYQAFLTAVKYFYKDHFNELFYLEDLEGWHPSKIDVP